MQNDQEQYHPGVCNIGRKEIGVRKKFIRFFLPLTLLLTFAALHWPNSLLIWVLLLGAAFSLVVLYFEIRYRFCILFGFFNLYNFGPLGNLGEIKNPEHSRTDRKRVLEIMLQSLLLATLYSVLVHMMASLYGN